MVTRKPAYAGRFYNGNSSLLTQDLNSLVRPVPDEAKKKVLGGISPHAAYMYSGRVAGELYSRIEIPARIIILSPNHTGRGARLSLFPDGYWETPLGNVEVDPQLCTLIYSHYEQIERETEAHEFEHSIEVQLPFLQHFRDDFTIVPITLMRLGYEECEKLAGAISDSVKELGEEVLIIASSDLNHYQDQTVTEKKDMMAIDRVLSLDPEGLLDVASTESISMCGVIPTIVTLLTCRELEAKKAELLKHATSGDVTGDYEHVVGYAAIWVY